MVFQYYYLLYPYESNYNNKSQINQHISKGDYDDIFVKVILKTMDDLYIIDVYEAEKYLKQNKKLYVLDEYYKMIGQTFKKYKELTTFEIMQLKSPIYLLQRPIDFDNELIEIM
jgi:hypothetical protein